MVFNQLYIEWGGESHLSACPAFLVHPNIFLDNISLCLEACTRVLGFSEAHTFNILKKNRLTGFELRRKQGMIQNLSMNERNVDSAQFKETNADSLIKRPNFSYHKQPTFSCRTTFPKFLYIFYTFYTPIVLLTSVI